MVCHSQESIYLSDFGRTERGSRNAEERYLQAMIHAYIDDSGDALRREYAVCGGILGEAFMMTCSESLWATETKALSQPFRSTDCECQHGQFQKWEKPQCNELMVRLVDVLTHPSCMVGLFGTAVPIAKFKEMFPNSEKDDALRLAVRHTLIGLVRLCRRNNEQVKVWFESGPNDADMLRAYNDVRAFQFQNPAERNRLAGIAFGDKTLIPLQAADLAARECFKAATNRGKRPTRKSLKRLWGQSGMVELTDECLQKIQNSGNATLSIRAVNEMGPTCFPRIVTATPTSSHIEPM